MGNRLRRALARAVCIGAVVATAFAGMTSVSPVTAAEPWARTGDTPEEIADYLESVAQVSEDSGQSEASIIAQDKIRAEADAALELAASLPNFAGSYADRGEGVAFHLYINLSDGGVGQDEIESLLPNGYPVTFNHVAYNAAEMQAEVEQIADKYGKTDVSLSLSARNGNTIQGSTPGGARSESAQAVQALTKFPITFSDGPLALNTSCTNNTACTPIRGGVQVCPQDFHQTWCGNITLSAKGLRIPALRAGRSVSTTLSTDGKVASASETTGCATT